MKFLMVPDGELPAAVDGEPTLEWLQGALGGYVGTIGLAPFGPDEPPAVLWYGEDGKAKGSPQNPLGTLLLRRAGGFPDDWIAGPALLTGPAGRDGEVTPLGAAWFRRFDPAAREEDPA